MNFQTFEKCLQFVKDWREKEDKPDHEYPDSRDPSFTDILTDGIVPQDVEKALVALCAYREFNNEKYQGMSACVHLIRNRQVKGWYRDHLTLKEQFGSMVSPGSPSLTDYPSSDNLEFNELLKNVDIILEGKTIDITQGSLHFVPANGSIKDKDSLHTRVAGRVFYK